MKELLFTLELGSIVKIEIDDKTLYLPAWLLAGNGDGVANVIELQAIDDKGKCHIIEIQKIKELPKGWKASDYTRLKLNP